MIVNRKRKLDFQTYKVRGRGFVRGKVHLLYLERSIGHARIWDIPLEHGGKLAITPPSIVRTLRPVGIRSLDPLNAQRVQDCIAYIEKHGNPIQNDEHIYSESGPTPIHDDGYADGGEPYTDAEIAAMGLLKD